MRIGIFSECYQPTLNGVVVSTDTFKDELTKMGHEVFIFAPRTKGFVDKDPKHVFRYPSTTLFGPNDYPIGFPVLAPSIAKKAVQLNLDIIHAQHSLAMISHSALKIARQLNIPIVHTYHTLLTDYVHWKIGASLGRWYVKDKSTKFCNKCDQIIAPSTPMKKIVEAYGVKTPIEVIPTGIDLKEFQNPFSKEELYSKWQVPKDKKILLYLSRIASEKNLDFLFEAVAKIAKNRKDFHLLLVGGGTELPKFKSKAKKIGIDSITTFTDKQPKEIANRIFPAADIFVFPSITETQGIVIAEAMAAGAPAVAVNKMGPTDIIKDGVDGYLVDLKVDEFAGKIEKLLEDDNLRKKMGQTASKYVEEFSVKACAQKMESLYERLTSYYSPKPNA